MCRQIQQLRHNHRASGGETSGQAIQRVSSVPTGQQHKPDCKFTCHPECRSLIQLDCRQKEGPALDRHSPESTLTPTFNQGKKSIDFQQLTEAVLYECSCILFVQAFVPVCVCGTGEGTWSLVHSPEAFTIYR
ncbi:ras association domain-containing protein 5 [Cricetulus griseus]|nr:ras association domain-containing protein 5 [Cricetulus griseus]